MQDLAQDVRYALRGLRRAPGFTAAAVLTLALGIGANTAIFSVVNGVLFRPLGYPEPERLLAISTQFPTLGFDRFWMSPPEYVMPAGFDIDDAGVQVWVPAALDAADRGNRGSHFLNVVARLRPGVTRAAADAELAALLLRWQDAFPGVHAPHPENHRVVAEPLEARLTGGVRTGLLLLLAAVAFVLLIACVNVGNLLLARAEARQREVSVRSALGAGRSRLVRLFLIEGVTLGVIGGAAGLVLAWSGLTLLLATSAGSLPRNDAIGLDAAVLGFTLAVSVLSGLAFGMAPALHLRAGASGRALREGGARTTGGASRRRVRAVLVASETALAVVLVIGAGLMLRSFANLLRVDPGFRADGLLTFEVFLPAADYPDAAGQLAFHQRLEQRLRAVPGVTAAAAMSGLPPIRDVDANDMEFEGHAFTPGSGMPVPNADYWQFVTTGYLAAMGIPVVAGRGFEATDAAGAAPVALINETLARVFYPGQDPVGRRLRPGFGDPPWFTIVGVVRDVKQGGLGERTGTEVYFHYPQIGDYATPPRAMNVVVRSARPVTAVAPAVRQAVRALDPGLPVANLRTMLDVLQASIARPRLAVLLLGLFGAMALALAAVGIYGVMSFAVAQRTREIGIRMALGAGEPHVLRMVVAGGLRVAGAGLVAGIAGGVAASRLMNAVLFEVSAADPAVFVAAAATLAATATLACWLPARRAARVDPATVLRAD
jgi:putative ABC transport system permease protein